MNPNVSIHHAPWSRRFRTMYVHGSVAREVQVGCLVIQVFYQKPAAIARHGRIHIWRDYYTNSRRYLRRALWGTAGPGPIHV